MAQKREDMLVDLLCNTLEQNPPLRETAWIALMGNKKSGVGQFENHPPLGEAKPDILLRSPDGELVAYVEAKVSSQLEPLQLFRGRSWLRRESGRNARVIFLYEMEETLPDCIGITHSANWYHRVHWETLLNALDSAAKKCRPSLINETEILRDFYNNSPRKPIKSIDGVKSEEGYRYGSVFEQLRKISEKDGYECDFAFRGRVSPRLFVGHPLWTKIFPKGEFQRLIVAYGMPRHTGLKYERFNFQFLLWHRGDLADTDEIAAETRIGWLKKCLSHLDNIKIEVGGRQGNDREYINNNRGVLDDDWKKYVALFTYSKGEMHQDQYIEKSPEQVADLLYKRIREIDCIIRALRSD